LLEGEGETAACIFRRCALERQRCAGGRRSEGYESADADRKRRG
jgi:hypothetical protein